MAALISILAWCCNNANASVISSSILVLRILHIPLVRSALSFLDCHPDTKLLEADPNIECGSEEQKMLKVFGILSLVLFGFGLIFTFQLILYSNKEELLKVTRDPQLVGKYG